MPINTVNTALNGAAAVTFAAWARFASTSSAAAADNRILHSYINGTAAGLVLNFDNNTSGWNVRIRGGCRAAAGDTTQQKTGDTNLSADTWYHVGAVFNVAADTITVYVNGAADGSASVTFTQSAYTAGTASATYVDSIGGQFNGASLVSALTGRVADVAVWSADIGATGFARLAAGDRPNRVSPSSLRLFFPLYGISSEQNVVGSGTLTAVSSPTASAHPAMRPLFAGAGG